MHRPWSKRICILTSQAAEALDVIKSDALILRTPVLNHVVGLWECLVIIREAILEAADTLFLARRWFCVTPVATTEALRGDAGTF